MRKESCWPQTGPRVSCLRFQTVRHWREKVFRDYLPVLSDALDLAAGTEQFHTAAQCQGTRQNGEIFLAHTWFSTYKTGDHLRLAAIVVDASEEMREREESGLRQLARSSRITAAAVSHEIRNLCGAISLMYQNLKDKSSSYGDEASSASEVW